MKTSELIDELYELGFVKIVKKHPLIKVSDKIGYDIAYINVEELGLVDTICNGYVKLNDNNKLKVLEKLYGYAITPVNERGNEDGY